MSFAGEPSEAHQDNVPVLINARHQLRQRTAFVLVQIMPDVAGDNSDFSDHFTLLLRFASTMPSSLGLKAFEPIMIDAAAA